MHFTVEAQNMAKPYLTAGSIAIDATVGNGFDTLFLAENVGDSGVVYGVDIQSVSIDRVHQKLHDAKVEKRCKLHCASHAQLDRLVDQQHFGKVSVAMFNLGYLPFGDKSITTQQDSTLAALDHTTKLIRIGGLISVLAYPGHSGGFEEAMGVEKWIEQNATRFGIQRFQDANNANSPILWILIRLP